MTGYVLTRYYRAREIMLTWQKYGAEVGIWSAVRISVAKLDGKPLFPGKDHVNQFFLIMVLVQLRLVSLHALHSLNLTKLSISNILTITSLLHSSSILVLQ